ncbi:MAG: Dabb family protein [Sarcina sp.]
MIKHIVMWKLKEFANGKPKSENALIMKVLLEGLKEYIDEIKFIEVGIDFSDSESSYDVILISEFESEKGLEAYINNPKHIEVSDFVTGIREERKVVDFIV